MEMQVRSSIQDLVLVFRADATDTQRWDYKCARTCKHYH